MSDSDHNQNPDAIADEDEAVSRAYRRSAVEQAPEHLDDAILAASRRAVKSRPVFACVPGRSSWQGPVSIAAVLVLSVGLVFTLQHQTREGKLGESPVTLYEDDAVPGGTQIHKAGKTTSAPMFAPNRSADLADSPVSREETGSEQVMSPPAPAAMKKSVPVTETEVEMLRDEISALQHDQRALEQEKAALKREIAEVEARQRDLQRQVSGLYTESDAITIEGSRAQVAWLSYIRNLLKDNAVSLASSNLRDFHLANPKYPRDRLEQILPPEFVEAVLDNVPVDG